MKSFAFYNEHDPKAAAWLRELIARDLIPDGVVDERSIADIVPGDVAGFTQVHFFAGIGGWSLALQLAGWPADRSVWTGSCPCQPFSSAGQGQGQSDPRHLWPEGYRLIRECRPNVVFGEQVESAIGHGWLDGIQSDLEGEGYAVGHCVLGAHSVGAPHIRQRLYWVADSQRAERRALDSSCGDGGRDVLPQGREGPSGIGSGGEDGGVAFTSGEQSHGNRDARGGRGELADGGNVGGLEHAPSDGREQRRAESSGRGLERGCGPDCGLDYTPSDGAKLPGKTEQGSNRAYHGLLGAANPWSDFDLIPCRDGKSRRIESGTFPLVAGLPRGMVPSGDPSIQEAQASGEERVARLKGYGNSIVPQVAAIFIKSYMETAFTRI